MRTPHSVSSVLRQFALALLNATLMLAIILMVFTWLVLGRMQDVAADTRTALHEALAPQAARLERIATSAEAIDAQLSERAGAEAIRSEFSALRSDIGELRESIETARQIGPRQLAEEVMQEIANKITWKDRAAP